MNLDALKPGVEPIDEVVTDIEEPKSDVDMPEQVEEIEAGKPAEEEVVVECKTVTVVCPYLNVRNAPNKNAKILCTVKANEVLTICGKAPQGWRAITTPRAKKGFVMSKFVKE